MILVMLVVILIVIVVIVTIVVIIVMLRLPAHVHAPLNTTQDRGKAELWLSPCLGCSKSIFWRSSGEIPVNFWKNVF